jgi:hypothetical protein
MAGSSGAAAHPDTPEKEVIATINPEQYQRDKP